jgi:glycerol-1-phosphate dehydrogenase [NAD(P)+]
MILTSAADDKSLIEQALRSARHTRLLIARAGVRHETATVFASQFGERPAVIVADQNTFAAAGKDVCDSFTRARLPTSPALIFGRHIYADDECAQELQGILESSPAVPVAVGSGTINDLTKLAAYRVNRPYMVVATAASMDGYTAYGSIDHRAGL